MAINETRQRDSLKKAIADAKDELAALEDELVRINKEKHELLDAGDEEGFTELDDESELIKDNIIDVEQWLKNPILDVPKGVSGDLAMLRKVNRSAYDALMAILAKPEMKKQGYRVDPSSMHKEHIWFANDDSIRLSISSTRFPNGKLIPRMDAWTKKRTSSLVWNGFNWKKEW